MNRPETQQVSLELTNKSAGMQQCSIGFLCLWTCRRLGFGRHGHWVVWVLGHNNFGIAGAFKRDSTFQQLAASVAGPAI
jgi:hypothetical protein